MGAGRSKSSSSTREFEKDLKFMFELFDKNGDKSISLDELGEVLGCGSVTMSEEEIRKAMNEIDKNGDGKIEYKEFRKYMLKQLRKPVSKEIYQEEVKQVFRLFDKDGNGYIDRDELHEVLSMLGGEFPAESLDPIISYVDKNNDGKLDMQEFVVLWSGLQDDIQQKAMEACNN